jgi:hypothetical protein
VALEDTSYSSRTIITGPLTSSTRIPVADATGYDWHELT